MDMHQAPTQSLVLDPDTRSLIDIALSFGLP